MSATASVKMAGSLSFPKLTVEFRCSVSTAHVYGQVVAVAIFACAYPQPFSRFFPRKKLEEGSSSSVKNGGRLVLLRGKKARPLVSDMKRKSPNFDTFVPPTVTLSVAARTSGGDRNKLRKGIIGPLLEDSVYGHILQKCPIQFTNGEAYEWEYINPFALIHQYTSARPRFGDMLREAGSMRIALYMDETTPGNVPRPDHGRSLACFCWTFMEAATVAGFISGFFLCLWLSTQQAPILSCLPS